MFSKTSALVILVLATTAATAQQELPSYRPVKGVTGSIVSEGSDTMNNLMALWAEGFKRYYPSVTVEITGKGSSTAPPALIAGKSNFGPMSRTMKDKETDEFEKVYGYKPIGLPTSIDMLAVYVNKDNPIKNLTLAQVDAIFSKTRKLGHDEARTWGDLGLTGPWAKRPISLYGRNAASGTYGYFKEKAMGKGDYKDEVKAQPGSSAVVQGIARDKFAIGYSGIGYKTADVRAVPLSKDDRSTAVDPSPDSVAQYPLARYLLLYINKNPQQELEPLRREFIKYIFSQEGQEAVRKDGYIPVTRAIAEKALGMVGLTLEGSETSSR